MFQTSCILTIDNTVKRHWEGGGPPLVTPSTGGDTRIKLNFCGTTLEDGEGGWNWWGDDS